MLKKLLVTTCLSIFFLGFLLFYCQLPQPPAGPDQVRIDVSLRSSDGKTAGFEIYDSTGNQPQIRVIFSLTHYIDSAKIEIISDTTIEQTIPCRYKISQVDTVYYPVSFKTAGTRIIRVTGFIDGYLNIVSKVTIHIIDRTSSNKNQKPVLIIPGMQKVGVGQTVSFFVSATDTDSDQKVTVKVLQKPENATFITDTFRWSPAIEDTGTHTIIFIATDNGSPVLTDTESVIIHVSATQVNRAPQWSTKNIQRTAKSGTQFSFDFGNDCIDPDSESITFSLIPEQPANDTITGTTYSYTPAISDTGKHIIHIIAKDPSGFTDTLSLELSVLDNNGPDKFPPIIKFQSPSKDTVISADSFEVKVTCIDDSGCSVKGYRDAVAITMKKASSVANLWTGMAKGITSGSYSTIKIVATDSSSAKNKDSNIVRIKYDNDKSGPVIILVTPAKDSITTSTSSYQIVLKVTDASGILSVNGGSGTATYTGVRDTGSLWKINVNTLENNKITAIALTAIDSSLKANQSNDTIYIKSVIVNGHSITFNKNDSAATGTMSKQTINSSDSAKLSINAFVKDGSSISGWAKTPAGAIVFADGANYIMGTSDDTLYAVWTKNSVTITFDKNGGSSDAIPATKVVSSGATVDVLPASPTRAGFTFSGWNTSSSGNGTAFTATTRVTINDTVFGQWTPITYAITYNLNGGTNNVNNPTSYNGTSTITFLNPTNTGFTFVGWFDNANFTGTIISSIPLGSTGAKSFWAKWVVMDRDGNTYDTVVINGVTWMKTNLKTGTLSGGTNIFKEYVTDWGSDQNPQCCNYNFDPNNGKVHGLLYNASAAKSSMLPPDGWHVATKEEWLALVPNPNIASSIASIYFWNGIGTNTIGFSATPGGAIQCDAYSVDQGSMGYWWTSTMGSKLNFVQFGLVHGILGYDVTESTNEDCIGYSIRCVLNH